MEQVGPSLDGAGQCSAGCGIAKPSTANGGHIDECTRLHGLVGFFRPTPSWLRQVV